MYISVKEYGAVGDGITSDTKAIQKAIDDCSQTGRIVYFPSGVFKTGTLFLKNHTHLFLSSYAVIQSVQNYDELSEDVPVCIEAPKFTKCFIYAENATNISIMGDGIIDGMGKSFEGKRPMLIRFVNCKKILFRDVTFKSAGSWCTHMITCQDLNIDGITIYNRVQRNNDGLDLDGCKDVRISNCNISSGDDSICLKSTTDSLCENIAVTNCNVTSNTAAVKFGTSSKAGFRNIAISNCTFKNCPMGAIKLLMVDGGLLENVTINNIAMHNVGSPLFIRLGMRNLTFEKPAEMNHEKFTEDKDNNNKVGSIKNVIISNITAYVNSEKFRNPIMIAGLENSKIKNIDISNIYAEYPGGGTSEDRKIVVDEDPYRYPELGHFGVLPVWGIYARHVDGLRLNNINLSLYENDERNATYFEDVSNLDINKLNTK